MHQDLEAVLTHLDCMPPVSCPHLRVNSTLPRFFSEYMTRPINNLVRVCWVAKESLNGDDDVAVLYEVFLPWTILERNPLLHPRSSVGHRVHLLQQGAHVVIRQPKTMSKLDMLMSTAGMWKYNTATYVSNVE